MLLSVRYPTLRYPFRFRPRLTLVPALLNSSLSFLQGHAVCPRHRAPTRPGIPS
jgi:hypothetical protein